MGSPKYDRALKSHRTKSDKTLFPEIRKYKGINLSRGSFSISDKSKQQQSVDIYAGARKISAFQDALERLEHSHVKSVSAIKYDPYKMGDRVIITQPEASVYSNQQTSQVSANTKSIRHEESGLRSRPAMQKIKDSIVARHKGSFTDNPVRVGVTTDDKNKSTAQTEGISAYQKKVRHMRALLAAADEELANGTRHIKVTDEVKNEAMGISANFNAAVYPTVRPKDIVDRMEGVFMNFKKHKEKFRQIGQNMREEVMKLSIV